MDPMNKDNLCPVCGYDLGFKAWNGNSPSHEICPSCGMQFGYYDGAGNDKPGLREERHDKWRKAWIAKGCKWSGVRRPPPGWNPYEQLKRIGQSNMAEDCKKE